MAKTKRAAKKAARPTPRKVGKKPLPISEPRRAVYQNRLIHIQYADGKEEKIIPAVLHPELHSQFIQNQVRVENGALVVPYSGSELRFTGKQLANGFGRPEADDEKFVFQFIKLQKLIMGFGPWLEKQLKRRSMEQKDFASKLGVAPSVVSKLISSSKPPKIRTVLNVLNALNISLDHI